MTEETGTPTDDRRCRWCGSTYDEHEDSRPPNAPQPRMPCLGLKANFLACEPEAAVTAMHTWGPGELVKYPRDDFRRAPDAETFTISLLQTVPREFVEAGRAGLRVPPGRTLTLEIAGTTATWKLGKDGT